MPPLPLPGLDTLSIVKLHNALADPAGKWADPEHRAMAAGLGDMFPARSRHSTAPGGSPGEQVLEARRLHQRAAAWAVTAETDTATGVVFGAAGFPCHPDPHTEALARAPHARFVFTDNDPRVVLVNKGEFGGDRVASCRASLRDPARLMALDEVQALGGPIQLQAQLCGHWWPPGLARELVAAYAELLPEGSTFLLSMGIPSPSPAGEQFTRMLSRVGGSPVYVHTEDDVASWFGDPGMELLGLDPAWPVRGVRARGQPWAAVLALPRETEPGLIVYVSARKPRRP